MQQIDDAIPPDSGAPPSGNQGAARASASDARSVQAMPRLLLVMTVILLCLRVAAYVVQSHAPAANTQKSPALNQGAEL